MSKKDRKPESKLIRLLKSPIRVLIRARDFYIRSMTDCADRVSYGSVMGCPTGQVSSLPRSFSVNSTKSSSQDEDLRELIRAASTRSLGNKVQAELLRRENSLAPAFGPKGVPRSFSVGIGKIDEDKPCEFGEDIKVNTEMFPRSRSHAVSKRPGFI